MDGIGHSALKEWLLLWLWDTLDTKTLSTFKNKTLKVSKKCWPQGLQTGGNLAWLYHNHMVFSGNVPKWADWNWCNKRDKDLFKLHFYYLLIGAHPAGGSEACCLRLLCRGSNKGMVYQHHYFECGDYVRNRMFFQNRARGLYNKMIVDGQYYFPQRVLDDILQEPSGMWIGLFDTCLFELGLKLPILHELHRIVTMASVMSWGRFYALPGGSS